jgi:copper chaperone CopZ
MVTRFTLTGMRSVHCVRAVFTALAGVEGVARAEVAMGEALVEHDGRATPAAVAAGLEPLGYGVAGWRRERGLPVL